MSIDYRAGSSRARTTSGPGKPLTPRQVAFAAMFGNAIELYDFLISAYMAGLVFGPLFFPTDVPWIGVLLAFAGQAVAFFARPLGAVIFGGIGDRVGRRAALLWSLGLMGGSTVAVGLLPTYAVAGVAAPILLVALRLVQGISIGGEYPGAVVATVEHAPIRRKTLYGAFPQIGNQLGSLLAGVVLVAINVAVGREVLLDWAWRVPFLASAVLVVIGFVLRTRLSETPDFVAAVEQAAKRGCREPLGALLRRAAKPVAIMTLIWIGPLSFGYAFLTSLVAFVGNWRPGLSPLDVQIGLVLTSVVLIGSVLVSALYGDRVGADRIVLLAGLAIVVWAVPSYLLVDLENVAALWLAMVVGSLAYGAFGGVAPRLMATMFETEIRYFGVAACIALSGVIAGALLPIPALAWVGQANGSSAPLMVMVVVAGLATVCGALWLRRDNARKAPERLDDGGTTA